MNRAGLHAKNILKGLAVETRRKGSVLEHQASVGRVAGIDSIALLSQWPLHTHTHTHTHRAVTLSQQKHYELVVFVGRTDCSLGGKH